MRQSLFSQPEGQEKAPTSGHCAGYVLQMMGAQELWSPAALYISFCMEESGSGSHRLTQMGLSGQD